jgi:hypothetical protein
MPPALCLPSSLTACPPLCASDSLITRCLSGEPLPGVGGEGGSRQGGQGRCAGRRVVDGVPRGRHAWAGQDGELSLSFVTPYLSSEIGLD